MTNSNAYQVILEGNFGSGKSELLAALKASSNEIDVYPKALRGDIMSRHPTLLDLHCKSPKRWNYTVQQYSMFLMLERNRSALFSTASVKIYERSLGAVVNVFAPALLTYKQITQIELDLLMDWAAELAIHDAVKPDLIIYLRRDPQKCLEKCKNLPGHQMGRLLAKVR